MQAKIHPDYKEIQVTCTCGNSFKVPSTLCKSLHVDICASCHPFFTGQQKVVDTAKRIDRFNKKYAKKKQPAEKTDKTDQ